MQVSLDGKGEVVKDDYVSRRRELCEGPCLNSREENYVHSCY